MELGTKEDLLLLHRIRMVLCTSYRNGHGQLDRILVHFEICSYLELMYGIFTSTKCGGFMEKNMLILLFSSNGQSSGALFQRIFQNLYK